MPNLFPVETGSPDPLDATRTPVKFRRSFRFDFDKGEFVVDGGNRVTESEGVDAWLEWCKKALMTPRYRYLAYTRSYGQEFDDLIARHLSRAANEAEIKRIAAECLMLDTRTKSVENFTFAWEGDVVYFTCEVSNVRGETGTIEGKVVI